MSTPPVINTSAIQEDKPLTLASFIKLLTKAYFVTFVVYLTYLIIQQGNDKAIQQFVQLRDNIYIGFAVIITITAIYVLLRREKSTQESLKNEIIPQIITGVIVTTFSYFFAEILAKILSLLDLV